MLGIKAIGSMEHRLGSLLPWGKLLGTAARSLAQLELFWGNRDTVWAMFSVASLLSLC